MQQTIQQNVATLLSGAGQHSVGNIATISQQSAGLATAVAGGHQTGMAQLQGQPQGLVQLLQGNNQTVGQPVTGLVQQVQLQGQPGQQALAQNAGLLQALGQHTGGVVQIQGASFQQQQRQQPQQQQPQQQKQRTILQAANVVNLNMGQLRPMRNTVQLRPQGSISVVHGSQGRQLQSLQGIQTSTQGVQLQHLQGISSSPSIVQLQSRQGVPVSNTAVQIQGLQSSGQLNLQGTRFYIEGNQVLAAAPKQQLPQVNMGNFQRVAAVPSLTQVQISNLQQQQQQQLNIGSVHPATSISTNTTSQPLRPQILSTPAGTHVSIKSYISTSTSRLPQSSSSSSGYSGVVHHTPTNSVPSTSRVVRPLTAKVRPMLKPAKASKTSQLPLSQNAVVSTSPSIAVVSSFQQSVSPQQVSIQSPSRSAAPPNVTVTVSSMGGTNIPSAVGPPRAALAVTAQSPLQQQHQQAQKIKTIQLSPKEQQQLQMLQRQIKTLLGLQKRNPQQQRQLHELGSQQQNLLLNGDIKARQAHQRMRGRQQQNPAGSVGTSLATSQAIFTSAAPLSTNIQGLTSDVLRFTRQQPQPLTETGQPQVQVLSSEFLLIFFPT